MSNDPLYQTLVYPELLRRQAHEALQARRWAEASHCLRELLSINPNDAWSHQWNVLAAMSLEQPEQAVQAAQHALLQLPFSETWARVNIVSYLGEAYELLRRNRDALRSFEQLLDIDPNHVSALLGRARSLAKLMDHEEAARTAIYVLELHPENLDAMAIGAQSLTKAGAPEKALPMFMQYEALKPAAPYNACMVVFLMRQLADWSIPNLPANDDEKRLQLQAQESGQRPELAMLAARAWRNMPALDPFSSLVLFDDPALHKHSAHLLLRHMNQDIQDIQPHEHVPDVLKPHQLKSAPRTHPIKVAYISCECCEHATSYLLAGVLARHNPARVHVHLLNFAPPRPVDQHDEMRRRIATMGHTWVDIHEWTDAKVAQWCRDQGVQVAVDLMGLTCGNRIGIFSHRAAPVQVNWLGYPGTLPAPYFDWILADDRVLPPTLEPYFCERVWRLPHSYQPNDPDRFIDPQPQSRAEHGLPLAGPVLVCFSNTFKITPQVWSIWMRLLHARKDAVLWLLAGPEVSQQNLRSRAEAAGVDPQRLVFAPTLPQAKHLARLALADLSLDTLPYNAHTTASDALWVGVPHIACTGTSFAARVGASLLTAAGMPELIAYGLPAYEALAQRLLCDDVERAAVRKRLAEMRTTAPLWDAHAFAFALEDAYIAMWRAFRAQV